MGRLICISSLAAICTLAFAAVPASAAVDAYVGCSVAATAAPSHACLIGDEPGAFFESDTEVEYDVCLDTPLGEPSCAEEQLAEAGTLYVNAITIEVPGEYLVTWFVEEVEVASWSFRMDPRPAAALPTPPPPVIPPPPPPVPSAIGCAARGAGSSFLERPSRCVVYRQNHRDRAHEILMKNLRWSGWGRATATANGRWKRCTAGSCSSGPLKAVASEPILACGHFSYTRLSVQVTNGKRQSNYRLQLPKC